MFTRFIDEADELKEKLTVKGVKADIVTGTTPKREREDILAKFKIGLLKVVVNVGTLTTGFDYPELDTIILGRPTKSLALYYQMVGRAIRPYKGKDAWIVDLGGSYKFFGRVDELKIECPPGTSDYAYSKKSLELTEEWLDRCIKRFNETEPKYGYSQSLFPIVQGCTYKDLRERAAENIASKGADGNAIGGLAVGEPTDGQCL